MKQPMSDKKFAKFTLTGCAALVLAGILLSHPGPGLVAVALMCLLGTLALWESMTDGLPVRRSPEALAYEAEWKANQAKIDAVLDENIVGWKEARAKVHAELEAEGKAIREYPDPHRVTH